MEFSTSALRQDEVSDDKDSYEEYNEHPSEFRDQGDNVKKEYY
jgi:hypothetical protein